MSNNKKSMGDSGTYFGVRKLYDETIDYIEQFKKISLREFANMEIEQIIIKLEDIKGYTDFPEEIIKKRGGIV